MKELKGFMSHVIWNKDLYNALKTIAINDPRPIGSVFILELLKTGHLILKGPPPRYFAITFKGLWTVFIYERTGVFIS